MKLCIIGFAGLTLLFLNGCASTQDLSLKPPPSISEEARADLDRPVNCKTARSDIAALEDNKASTGRRFVAGARAILPLSVIGGLLTNDYGNRFQVATGQYNNQLQSKIDDIKRTCRIA